MSNIALTHMTVLKIEAPDAQKFLQGQLTCDVVKLPEGQGTLGGYCTIKGRLLSVFYLLCFSKQLYWMICPKSVASTTRDTLMKYGAFSRAKIIDLGEDQPLFGSFSEQSSEFGTIEESTMVIDKNRSICWGPQTEASSDLEAWVTADAHCQLPWIEEQTQSQLLPHHCGLVEQEGVSFEKGCYLGQEIVARMHYKGNIKKHAKVLSGFSSTPQAGQILEDKDGKNVGTVLYGAGALALCVVNDGAEGVLP